MILKNEKSSKMIHTLRIFAKGLDVSIVNAYIQVANRSQVTHVAGICLNGLYKGCIAPAQSIRIGDQRKCWIQT